MGLLYLGDYAHHSRTDKAGANGIPDLLWFGIPIALGVGSVLLVWQGAKRHKHLWAAALETVVHVGVGVTIYLVATLYYVLNAGVDSL